MTHDRAIAVHETLMRLQDAIERSVLGQSRLVRRLLIGLLADGHLLVEGFPGLAKTRAIKTLGAALDVQFSRIQFAPDLLPSDITGSELFYQGPDGGEFRFDPGPVFANLLLADEINRAPAKVQAALLEAMEERQVTVAGVSRRLPEVFLVMATQNPIEHEGTYPLPEAQLDRFLMHVTVNYPSADAEMAMLRLLRSGEGGATPEPVARAEDILAARAAVRAVHVGDALDRYIIDLVQATRTPAVHGPELADWIEVGASPRGSVALDRCARAHAWLMGRDFATPEDVRAVAHDVLRHRLVLGYEADAAGIDEDRVIDTLLERVRPL